MSNMYEVRDNKGKLKFDIPADVATDIITRRKGAWKNIELKNGSYKQRYVLEEDSHLEAGVWRTMAILYIFKGDRISQK